MKRHLREWHQRELDRARRRAGDVEFQASQTRLRTILETIFDITKDGATLEISAQRSGELFVVKVERRLNDVRRCRHEHGIESGAGQGLLDRHRVLVRALTALQIDTTGQAMHRRRPL